MMSFVVLKKMSLSVKTELFGRSLNGFLFFFLDLYLLRHIPSYLAKRSVNGGLRGQIKVSHSVIRRTTPPLKPKATPPENTTKGLRYLVSGAPFLLTIPIYAL